MNKGRRIPKVYIEANRDAYSNENLKTMTVRELISCLEDFDEDSLVYLEHDDGYTYGALDCSRIYTGSYNEDDKEIIDEIALRIANALAPGYDEYEVAADIYEVMVEDDLSIDEVLEQWIVNTKHENPEMLRDYREHFSGKRKFKRVREFDNHKNKKTYIFYTRESPEAPIAAETLEAEDLFEVIHNLFGRESLHTIKANIANECGIDIEDVTEEDAADYWRSILDDQVDEWYKIVRFEGPNFEWESADYEDEYDDEDYNY